MLFVTTRTGHATGAFQSRTGYVIPFTGFLIQIEDSSNVNTFEKIIGDISELYIIYIGIIYI